MADLFQLLNISRDAALDFGAVKQGFFWRLKQIRRTMKGASEAQTLQAIDEAKRAFRVLSEEGPRNRYLAQLRQDSAIGAARREQDAQFQQEAVQHKTNIGPPGLPPLPPTPLPPLPSTAAPLPTLIPLPSTPPRLARAAKAAALERQAAAARAAASEREAAAEVANIAATAGSDFDPFAVVGAEWWSQGNNGSQQANGFETNGFGHNNGFGQTVGTEQTNGFGQAKGFGQTNGFKQGNGFGITSGGNFQQGNQSQPNNGPQGFQQGQQSTGFQQGIGFQGVNAIQQDNGYQKNNPIQQGAGFQQGQQGTTFHQNQQGIGLGIGFHPGQQGTGLPQGNAIQQGTGFQQGQQGIGVWPGQQSNGFPPGQQGTGIEQTDGFGYGFQQGNEFPQFNEFQPGAGFQQGNGSGQGNGTAGGHALQDSLERLPVQWFKPLASYALRTIGGLKIEVGRTTDQTNATRQRLILALRNMPELVQALSEYFSIITTGFDMVQIQLAKLEDYCRPAANRTVRDDWHHRCSILGRLAAGRDLTHKFRDKATALQNATNELLKEDGSDPDREEELLNDVRIILEKWLRLINTFYKGDESMEDIAQEIDMLNRGWR